METAFWKGRVRLGLNGGEGWEGEHEAPPNSQKNNLLLWMNTLSQSNFSSVDVCAEDAGMLSDSREHLSCLEFGFLSPPACQQQRGFSLEFAGVNTGYLLSEPLSVALRHLPLYSKKKRVLPEHF